MPWSRRQRQVTIAIAAAVATVLGALWFLHGGAFQVAGPAVRAWAIAEADRLSDGAYHLAISDLQVDAARSRIAIDSVELRTDSAANARRDVPLPRLAIRLRRCAVEGLDLARLARGQGLHVERFRCDSAHVDAEVPATLGDSDREGPGVFLALRDTLTLPGDLPSIEVDSLAFPDVALRLRIAGEHGATTLALDRLGVTFDSLAYAQGDSAALARTLLSRNVAVRLEEFHGRREGTDRLEVGSFEGDLVRGTVRLRRFDWAPMANGQADSLGLAALTVDSADIAGIDWRAFLTRGAALVRSIDLRGVAITSNAGGPSSDARAERDERWTARAALTALGRAVRVDTLEGHAITILHAEGADTARTTADRVALTGLHYSGSGQDGGGTLLGPVRIEVVNAAHAWQDYDASIGAFSLDLAEGTADAEGLHFGPTGSDLDFARRRRWRADRIDARADLLRVRGLEAAALIDRSAWHAALVAVGGLDLDVLSDKRMRPRPTSPRHRTPQGWLRTVGIPVLVDSIAVDGRVSYRERSAKDGMIGKLTFDAIDASIRHFVMLPAAGAPPIELRAEARLMNQAPLSLQVTLPPASPGFEMRWRGSVGRMPAAALNPLMLAVAPATFEKGEILRIEFEATTHDGDSRGTVRPRFQDLSVALPSVGRTGVLGGVRRAIAKTFANAFVVRSDNFVQAGKDPPRDGAIAHGWTPSESLIQHLWHALRDALIDVARM